MGRRNALSSLEELDQQILRTIHSEGIGLLHGTGGSALYFANRAKGVGSEYFADIAVDILEDIICEANYHQASGSLHIANPNCAPSYIINNFISVGLLDEGERINLQPTWDLIVESIKEVDLKLNRHDLFYGFIGQGILLMDYDLKAARPHVNRMIFALLQNLNKDEDTMYWSSPYPFHEAKEYSSTINLGLPHGMCGIILFLLRTIKKYGRDQEIFHGCLTAIKWIIEKIEETNYKLPYIYYPTTNGSGRIGWCYGDLTIAYALLSFHRMYNFEPAWKCGWQLIEMITRREMESTGIKFYQKYNYYDICFCHGTAGVAYMFWKLYNLTGKETLDEQSGFWLEKTVDGLRKLIPQIDEIKRNETSNPLIDPTLGLLTGITGAGLVISTLTSKTDTSWDSMFLLD